MALFWRDDAAWSVIEPLLPTSQPGARRLELAVLDLFRMENGKIAQLWPVIDDRGLQQRIAILPR